jgi:hypothetical protein
MNVAAMHIAVKMGLDKSEALSLPAFQEEEIDFWLNDAVDRFVKTRYSGNNPFGTSFEQSQKRVDDLRTLVTEARKVPALATDVFDKPHSYIVTTATFPIDYLLFLNDEVDITFNHSILGTPTTIRTGVTECTSDSYFTKVSDPYGEHVLHLDTARPLRLFSSKGVELITDGNNNVYYYTIPYYYMRYIRKPAVISKTGAVNCDLPEYTHREIVEMTINKLLENIESPRYQTHTVELNKIE